MSTSTVRMVVNGLEMDVVVDAHLVDEILIPRLEALAAQPADGRRFVFLAAPPGVGKSTLAAVLEERATGLDLDTIGIDGFHHRSKHLESTWIRGEDGPRRLADIKGAPETFDLDELERHLREAAHRDLLWPTYDRTLHDVVPASKVITAPLVIIEGNWLLLGEPGWDALSAYSSFNIFITADPALLRERLIQRKVRGGMDRTSATAFYHRSDGPNVDRVLRNTDTRKVDLMLHLNPDGTIDMGGHQ